MLMPWQEDLIINSCRRKSFKEIAETINVSIDVVTAFMKEHTDIEIPEKLQKRNASKPARKKEKPVITSAQLTPVIKRREEKVYKTVTRKMSEMVAVKIDHRTTIYVKSGSNIEKAKKNFLKYSNYKPI